MKQYKVKRGNIAIVLISLLFGVAFVLVLNNIVTLQDLKDRAQDILKDEEDLPPIEPIEEDSKKTPKEKFFVGTAWLHERYWKDDDGNAQGMRELLVFGDGELYEESYFVEEETQYKQRFKWKIGKGRIYKRLYYGLESQWEGAYYRIEDGMLVYKDRKYKRMR